MLGQMQSDINMMEIKIRFINMFIEDEIQIIKKSKMEIEEQLEKKNSQNR